MKFKLVAVSAPFRVVKQKKNNRQYVQEVIITMVHAWLRRCALDQHGAILRCALELRDHACMAYCKHDN
jgi:hypothetical protein